VRRNEGLPRLAQHFAHLGHQLALAIRLEAQLGLVERDDWRRLRQRQGKQEGSDPLSALTVMPEGNRLFRCPNCQAEQAEQVLTRWRNQSERQLAWCQPIFIHSLS
jgi:hypothetical protein